MECDRFAQLSAAFDGELPIAEGAALDQHVATCAPCAAARAGLRHLHDRLAPLRRTRAPAQDLGALFARNRARRRHAHLRQLTAIAAGALLTATAALGVAAATPRTPEATPEWPAPLTHLDPGLVLRDATSVRWPPEARLIDALLKERR